MLAAVIASLNVAVTVVASATFVAAFSGVTLLTVGAVVSGDRRERPHDIAGQRIPRGVLDPARAALHRRRVQRQVASGDVGVSVAVRVAAV